MTGFVRARYLVAASAADIDSRARALALEQSVELPLDGIRDERIRESVVARVRSISAVNGERHTVTLDLALDTTGLEASQLLNMLFGNCSLQPDVSLVDVDLPAALAQAAGGPRHGVAGIRVALGVHERAITAGSLKPLGMSPAEMAALAVQLARGGVDVIKDDHGVADQVYAPFAARVPAVQQAIDRCNRESGGHTVYAPTLSGPPKRLAEQVRILAGEGVRMALACPMLLGLSCFHELVSELSVPVLAHPAFAGGRIAPALVIGKLFRLFGADAVIFPNHGGRFAYTVAECRAIAAAARSPMHGLAAAIPVPAGGMRVERVAEMLDFYGPDTMLLIGGNLLLAADVEARTRAFVDSVERASVNAGVG